MASDNDELKIEKGVPLPTSRGGGILTILRLCEVGDSILYKKTQGSAASLAKLVGSEKGWKFTTRKVDGGIRIWRVA